MASKGIFVFKDVLIAKKTAITAVRDGLRRVVQTGLFSSSFHRQIVRSFLAADILTRNLSLTAVRRKNGLLHFGHILKVYASPLTASQTNLKRRLETGGKWG
jgi:hypothetical protein